MDEILLTAMRTGAASAMATKYLARQDAAVLGIIGTRAQASFQAEAICEVQPIQKIIGYDRDSEAAQSFAKSIKVPVEIVKSAREAVINSDVLVMVTTSKVPVFDGHDLRQGTHINAVGAFTPGASAISD